jgi:hypothetical protein
VTRFRFPLWYRVAVGLVFTALLVPYFLLRGGAGQAFARSLVDRVAPRIMPVLRAQAALPRMQRGEPAHGAYSLNGMIVQYQTYRMPAGAEEVVSRFEDAFRKSGYATKRIVVEGQPTLVGIHPKTMMMLAVRPGRDRSGVPIVRLSQQDLSQLKGDFRAEIKDVPAYPGAQGMLVSSVEGRPAQSLMFLAASSPANVADYYKQEMKSFGWNRIDASTEPRGPDFSVLSFDKRGAECSILLVADAETGGTLAMVTLTGAAPSA